MSLDTVFEAWPNLLLALPTFLASDPTSRSARLDLAIERGSGTPRTFFRRARLLSANPPATPAAAAPTATAGPLALLAAFLSMPTTPLAFGLVLLRLTRRLDEPDLLPLCRPRAPLLAFPREAVLEREAPLRRREDGVDFERAAPPEERDESLPDAPPPEREDALPLALELELFEEVPLPCLLPEATLLLAITHPSQSMQSPQDSPTRSAHA
jgi:hypothetical protein